MSAVFSVLRLFGVQQQFAEGLAGSLLTAITYVKGVLDQGSFKTSWFLQPKKIVGFGFFGISAPYMTVYCVLLTFGWLEFTNFVFRHFVIEVSQAVGILVYQTAFEQLEVASILAFVPLFVGLYLIGRWLGTRCAKHGIVVLAVVVMVVSIGLSLHVSRENVYRAALKQMTGYEEFVSVLIFIAITKMSVFSLAMGLGYFVGWRTRRARYVNYLLKKLPKVTRDSVIDLLYEETRRLSPST